MVTIAGPIGCRVYWEKYSSHIERHITSPSGSSTQPLAHFLSSFGQASCTVLAIPQLVLHRENDAP